MQEFERALAEAENLNILPERVNRVKAYSLFKQKQHDKYKEFLLS